MFKLANNNRVQEGICLADGADSLVWWILEMGKASVPCLVEHGKRPAADGGLETLGHVFFVSVGKSAWFW